MPCFQLFIGVGGRLTDQLRMSETSISTKTTDPAPVSARRRVSARPPTRLRHSFIALLFAGLLISLPTSAQSPLEALFQAVELNDIAATEAAITAGADLSAKNANGMTPADVAVDLGHFRIAHLLLARRTAAQKDKTTAPRVTDKGKAALKAPRKRLAAPKPTTPPKPKLADIVPPKKPEPAPMARATPAPIEPVPTPSPETPASDPLLENIPTVDEPPAAILEPPAPAPEPALPEPRPDDEIADTVPDKEPAQMAAKEPEEPGLFDNIWGGVKSVVTLWRFDWRL